MGAEDQRAFKSSQPVSYGGVNPTVVNAALAPPIGNSEFSNVYPHPHNYQHNVGFGMPVTVVVKSEVSIRSFSLI